MHYLIVGFLLISIGLLVRKFPHLIAGYGNMSQTERENAKANHVPTIAFLIFGGMGLVTMLGYVASLWLARPEIAGTVMMFALMGGTVILVISSNYLTNNRR